MATFTVTTAQNIDELTSKAGNDTYNVNGGTLTIDQDSRYGTNQTTSTALGNVTISATLGGKVTIDARYVRLIPFTGGSGNVPASNTTISQGSASGKLIGVWSALNAAPTAAASAMPASGYIKIKQWNSTEFSAGALTGITANASGASVAGWIELVGVESTTVTVPRLGSFEMKGEWFDLGTTSGSNTTTYQIPTSGSVTYVPAVWVETGTGTGVYEAYPCAGSATALAATFATDAIRGKVCWVSTAGLLRFQHDGTNSTGGYLPPAGRKIRIPNIITANCVSTGLTANVLPNATLGTRYDFTTTGGGVISIDKAALCWFPSFAQAFSVSLTNTCIATQLSISEIATPMNFSQVCVGQEAANTQYGLLMALCFAGGTWNNCTWTRATVSASGNYINSVADIYGFTFNYDKVMAFGARGNATTGSATITRATNCTWNNPTIGVGRQLLTTCTNVAYNSVTYYDHPATTTATGNPMYAFDLASNCLNVTVDGVAFGGLAGCQPYSGIMNVGAAGCTNIKLRNLGTPASPLSMGKDPVYGATWTRSSTTVTVTVAAGHGLKTGDYIYILQSSDSAGAVLGSKAVTVSSTTVFTYTGANSGASSGTLSYEMTMSAYLVSLASGAAANTVKVQRCYTPQLRTGIWTSDNSSKNILFESVWGPQYLGLVSPMLNGIAKNLMCTHTMTAQTAVYGTHWFDCFIANLPANTSGQSWARSSTTATVTSNGHGLITGALINVTVTSDAAAIVLGQKSITVTGVNTFTFTCLNAGGASGTITYEVIAGRVGLLMNEATADTDSQVSIESGTPAFTSAGGLYMPTIGQQVMFETPHYIKAHTKFLWGEAVMAGGTIGNHDITYSIDQGSGYSAYQNLYYPRAGGSGTSGQSTFTVTDATGVAVGDYVWGTGIAPLAKVTQINSNTITVDKANTATVSGVIRFNHLPSETIADSNVGFRMRIRIKTSTTNTAAITSLYVLTTNTTASRANQYPLDSIQASLALSGLQANSEVRIYRSSDGLELGGIENSSTSYSYDYVWETNVNVDVIIHHVSYEYIRLPGITLTSSGVSIPVQQRQDRNYSNPS